MTGQHPNGIYDPKKTYVTATKYAVSLSVPDHALSRFMNGPGYKLDDTVTLNVHYGDGTRIHRSEHDGIKFADQAAAYQYALDQFLLKEYKPLPPTPLPRTGIKAPDGRDFPWGPIVRHHKVGEYTIVEFQQDNSRTGYTEAETHGQTQYHVFIDGKDTGRSFLSLDSALVGAIAYKRSGPDSQAAEMFDLMTLGKLPEE